MKSVFVTLTGPTCAGKTHLSAYIKSLGLASIVSTTTRAPRAGEVNGVDYYFISEEESLHLERTNQLAELAVYRGVRYGVTKAEFAGKLDNNLGVAFLIVEPSGIEHYIKPALDIGAASLKYFIFADMETRMSRMKQRLTADLLAAATQDEVKKIVSANVDRIVSMTTAELNWITLADWDRVLSGTHSVEHNLEIILNDVKAAQAKAEEIDAFYNKQYTWARS